MPGCSLPFRVADAVVAVVVATVLGFIMCVGSESDGMARRKDLADLAIRSLVPKIMDLLFLRIAKITFAVFTLSRVCAHRRPFLLASVVGRLVGRLEGDAHIVRLRLDGLCGSAKFQPKNPRRSVLVRQLAELAFVTARPTGSAVSCGFTHFLVAFVMPAFKGAGLTRPYAYSYGVLPMKHISACCTSNIVFYLCNERA